MKVVDKWLRDKLISFGWKLIVSPSDTRMFGMPESMQAKPNNVLMCLHDEVHETNGCADSYYNRKRWMWNLQRPEGMSRKTEEEIVSHLMHGHEVVMLGGNDFVPVSAELIRRTQMTAGDIVGRLLGGG